MTATYPQRLADDPFYRVPVVRQRTDTSISFRDVPRRAIHMTPVSALGQMYWYANIKRSQTLRVVFTGFVDRNRFSVPKFTRVTTSVPADDAYLSISDPALALDPELGLAWYVGTHCADITGNIVRIIERVARQVGAEKVLLIGGSGGGFAALRFGALLKVPCAVFVYSPQTQITSYHVRHVRTMMRVCFPGYERRLPDFSRDYPTLDSLAELYTQTQAATPIYYFQNTNDPFHFENHCSPFVACIRDLENSGIRERQTLRVAHVASVPGHGEPTPDEFSEHLALARRHFATCMPFDWSLERKPEESAPTTPGIRALRT